MQGLLLTGASRCYSQVACPKPFTPSCPVPPPRIVPPGYHRAYTESLEFFDDINDREWSMLQTKVQSMTPNTKGDPRMRTHYAEPHFFFQDHYEPEFACRHERRIGSKGEGGKWVCDPHRYRSKQNCLVYSVGSNGDFGFEQAVQEEIGTHCEIHTFDFDDYSREAIPGVTFHQWGLAERTYQRPARRRGWFEKRKIHQLKSLQDTVKELGHTGRTIDLFKIDCEGCEWTSVQSWFDANIVLHQILVEVHAVNDKTVDFFETMRNNHYVITHKEANVLATISHAYEFVFHKLSSTFFEDGEDERPSTSHSGHY